MPIEVSCPSCSRQFRVPDKVAGKKIKCPKCQGVLPVPGPGSGVGSSVGVGSGVGVAGGSQVAAGTKWYMKTPDGAQYGPVPRTELDQWQAEGRITPECQLLEEGSPQWQWATDVYPAQPGPAAAAQNLAQAASPAPAAPAPAPAPAPANNDNPFAGLGATSAPAAGGAAPSSDPFSFAGADTSPTSRIRGGRRGGGGGRRGRKGGKRSGLVTAVAVINYIIGVGGILGCILVLAITASAGAAIEQQAAQNPGNEEAVQAARMLAGGFLTVVMVVGGIASLVHLAAGWGVQNREQWGRILTLILGGMAILSMNLLYGIFVLFVLLNKEYAEEFR